MRHLDDDEALRRLEERLGPESARSRIKREREAKPDRESFLLSPGFITGVLRLTGFLEWGRANAARVELVRNEFRSARLPSPFDGFTVLHLSDLHADANPAAMESLTRLIAGLDYDLCVMTGDYRALTYGDYRPCLDAIEGVRSVIRSPIYAVLGNHDTIAMVPDMEASSVRLLLNENVRIDRDRASIFLAGVEDPHFLRAADVAGAAARIPADAFSILLAHSPEVYREAAQARFDVLLAGHTHGGQICLPGGVPVVLHARAPRFMGRGSWKFEQMLGYTSTGAGSSIVPARFNCPPEAVLHRFVRI
jgi:predicted MPP superfamily phosphohydrolase